MKSLSWILSVARPLFVATLFAMPLGASASTRADNMSLEAASQFPLLKQLVQAPLSNPIFASPDATSVVKKCIFINGWNLPDNPVAGQSYSISWQGYVSGGSSYIMLYVKPPGGSSWYACGSGGVPSGGGYVHASGGFGFFASGTWQFAWAPGGTTPTSSSASLVVP